MSAKRLYVLFMRPPIFPVLCRLPFLWLYSTLPSLLLLSSSSSLLSSPTGVVKYTGNMAAQTTEISAVSCLSSAWPSTEVLFCSSLVFCGHSLLPTTKWHKQDPRSAMDLWHISLAQARTAIRSHVVCKTSPRTTRGKTVTTAWGSSIPDSTCTCEINSLAIPPLRQAIFRFPRENAAQAASLLVYGSRANHQTTLIST
ncbi:hypothetical protein K456DRAFT_973926 [Colletotrichum gloeosporioides 23]|nr:hypothetical protein K456DRAFT_973926 [Colletotrichum gloeosporioides 23]